MVIPLLLGLLVLVSGRLGDVDTRTLAGAAVVNDGDTITLGGERIRLRGIDAPELAQTCAADGRNYPCGRRAREALRALISGRSISCSGWERDRYGRLLATCEAAGIDLNRELVAQGWAVAYGRYGDAEKAAREADAGVWAGSFVRPHDWRAQHDALAESEHDLPALVVNWLREVFRFW